jgi:HK97 family phage prohead protease
MKKREIRFTAKALEVRAKSGSTGKTIGGYAAMFNSLADIGPFSEVIRPGAFKRTLAEGANVFCLFNHNEDLVLGRSTAGTLRLWEDEVGLQFECDLPNTTVANDLYESIQRKDIDQCSFGFMCDDDGDNWIPTQDGAGYLRELLDLDLIDVSAVTYPAYAATSVGVRSLFPEGMEEVQTRKAKAVSAEKEKRDAMGTANAGALVPKGFAVGYKKHDRCMRSEDPFNSVDEANGIINWADGSDEDRAADAPVKNKEKAAQGFAYVANDGEKRSDYLLPHHTIVDGEIAHSQAGVKQAVADFNNGSSDAVLIPEQHRADVFSHLQQEQALFIEGADTDKDEDATDAAEVAVGSPNVADGNPDTEINEGYKSVTQETETRKTKKVDGVELPASSFAYVGDEKVTSTWKLPIHFPGDNEKTINHIKNALARFPDTKGIPASESSAVYHKIVGAAKAHGIKVKGENSLPVASELRADADVAAITEHFKGVLVTFNADVTEFNQSLADGNVAITKQLIEARGLAAALIAGADICERAINAPTVAKAATDAEIARRKMRLRIALAK